jgi:hypothetical protein
LTNPVVDRSGWLRGTTPGSSVVDRHTRSSGKSGCTGCRSRPNVGRRGQNESNRCIGKLLAMPPSENHVSIRARLSGARDRSTLNSGTALIRPGKLRLSRAASTTGSSGVAGRGRTRSPWQLHTMPTVPASGAGSVTATRWSTTGPGK